MVETLEPICLLAADVHLVKDIQTTPLFVGAYLDQFGAANGRVYFAQNTADFGIELWSSDGTQEGTTLVKDIVPGPASVFPSNILGVDGTIYFTYGNALWKTDGTDAGTVSLKQNANFSFAYFKGIDGILFFTQGTELWRSDGTPAGTVLVRDLPRSPFGLTNANGTLYFTMVNSQSASEIWKSDGTSTGTVLVKEFPQVNSIAMTYAATSNGTVLLTAGTDQQGYELWKTDGTAEGTIQLKDIAPGQNSSLPGNFVNVQGVVYFTANDSAGRELWRTDGTEAGTVRVLDIVPGAAGSEPEKLLAVNDRLYFTAATKADGRELWISDGTAGGTARVADILPGVQGSTPQQLTAVGDSVYFIADDGVSGTELWRSDGTGNGTYLVRDIDKRPGLGIQATGLTAAGDKLFFGRGALWTSDGTEEGTLPIPSKGTQNLDAAFLTEMRGAVYFLVYSDEHRGLWRSDGTEEGTVRVREFAEVGTNRGQFLKFNDALYFAASDGVHGTELWTSDGTAEGTQMVSDLMAGPGNSFPREIQNLSDQLVLAADYPGIGPTYWRMNSTNHQMERITDRAVDTNRHPVMIDNKLLYFTATGGYQLWATDGTLAGNVRLNSMSPSELQVVGNSAYFIVTRPPLLREVWKTDGTRSGTVKVHSAGSNFSPSILGTLNNQLIFFDSYEHQLWAVGDNLLNRVALFKFQEVLFGLTISQRMYLVAVGNGPGLWMTDGTETGTVPVTAPNGKTFREVNMIGSLDEKLIFTTFENNTYQFWQTDGTKAGTKRLAGVENTGFVRFGILKATDDEIILSADEPTHGGEPWIINAEGMKLAADVWPGNFASNPEAVETVGNRLYLLAAGATVGRELFVIGESATDPDDRNGDGTVDIRDLDLLCSAVVSQKAQRQDVEAFWNRQRTGPGDVNLDHQFESSDLIAVFQNSKYNTADAALWSDGDWNCDGLFDSSDLIEAFQSGWYDQGEKQPA